MAKIHIFQMRGEWKELCLAFEHEFKLDEHRWFSVDHYLQASRAKSPEMSVAIRDAATLREAMLLARTSDTAEDWAQRKPVALERALRAKFESQRMRTKLAATGTAELIDATPGGGVLPENGYGKMLMSLRKEFADRVFQVKYIKNPEVVKWIGYK